MFSGSQNESIENWILEQETYFEAFGMTESEQDSKEKVSFNLNQSFLIRIAHSFPTISRTQTLINFNTFHNVSEGQFA